MIERTQEREKKHPHSHLFVYLDFINESIRSRDLKISHRKITVEILPSFFDQTEVLRREGRSRTHRMKVEKMCDP